MNNRELSIHKNGEDLVVEKTKELPHLQEVRNLSVNLTDHSVIALRDQRDQLHSVIKSQLKEGINGDFAQIPGTPKKTLLKPGAEKLANLFKLGSRIVNREREIDREGKFAFFSYTIEIFHIPTGAVIAQCEGSANSEERKNKNKSFADQLNSLGKMAQKRAYVGSVIMAVGASDFFSSDLEDTDMKSNGQEKAEKIQNEIEPRELGNDLHICEACRKPLVRTKANNAWYCSNYKDISSGNHTYIKDEKL